MTRAERMASKARRLETLAVRAVLRATSKTNPVGREAIRSGEVADARYRQSRQIRLAIEDQEAARLREKKKPRRQSKDWWKGVA